MRTMMGDSLATGYNADNSVALSFRSQTMPSIPAKQLFLADIEEKFGLHQTQDNSVFREWQSFSEPSAMERQWLDQVRADFLALSKHPLHEEIVKLVVLAPLLSLAGLCRPPFLPNAEAQVELAVADTDEIVRGRVDILVLHQQLWVAVVESKRKGLDVSAALPQALFYMLNNPHAARPTYGLATNGSHFLFIKLIQQSGLHYALSDEFSLRRQQNELYNVLAVLKQLAAITQGIQAA
jgi:hypothetical protein